METVSFKITVLMPVYNDEQYLRESIESILNQTFRDFEFLIVSEHGTSKESLAIIESYSDERIRHIHNATRLGLVGSLNHGLKEAKGEYIARMDADDISVLDRLEKQINFLKQNPNIALLGGAFEIINSNGTSVLMIKHPAEDHEIKDCLSRGCCFGHSTVIMRKDVIHTVGGYRSAFVHGEDYDLWLRISEHYKLANLLEPISFYRIHPNQVSSKNLKQQMISTLGAQVAAKIRCEKKHDPFKDVEIVSAEILKSFGVSDKTVQISIIKHHLALSYLMNLIGEKTVMFELLTEARNISNLNKFYDLKYVLAKGYFSCAWITIRNKRKYLEGFRLVIEAIALDPKIISTIILNSLWNRIKSKR